MSCIDQDQAFADAAVFEALAHLGGDIDEGPAAGDLKPEFLTVAFHGFGGGSRFLLKGATGPRRCQEQGGEENQPCRKGASKGASRAARPRQERGRHLGAPEASEAKLFQAKLRSEKQKKARSLERRNRVGASLRADIQVRPYKR